MLIVLLVLGVLLLLLLSPSLPPVLQLPSLLLPLCEEAPRRGSLPETSPLPLHVATPAGSPSTPLLLPTVVELAVVVLELVLLQQQADDERAVWGHLPSLEAGLLHGARNLAR